MPEASGNPQTGSQARTLFASPEEEKQKCSIQQNNMGWSASQVEILDPKNQKVSPRQASVPKLSSR